MGDSDHGDEAYGARDAPPSKVRKSYTCSKCQLVGHNARSCPNGDTAGRDAAEPEPKSKKERVCSRCHEKGHTARACKAGEGGGEGAAGQGAAAADMLELEASLVAGNGAAAAAEGGGEPAGGEEDGGAAGALVDATVVATSFLQTLQLAHAHLGSLTKYMPPGCPESVLHVDLMNHLATLCGL